MTPRDEWLIMANMIIPPVLSSNSEDTARYSSQYSLDLTRNLQLTRKAVSLGVVLAQLDGPLPIMDVVAVVGVTVYSAYLWREFNQDYY